MGRSYSGDLRRRVVAAVLTEAQPRALVAQRFAVGRSTVYRWIEAAVEEGRLEARPMRGGRRPVIRDAVEAVLRGLVAADGQLTQAEYRDELAAATGVRVHAWTLGRALHRLGLTRKKEDAESRGAGQRRGAGGAPSLA